MLKEIRQTLHFMYMLEGKYLFTRWTSLGQVGEGEIFGERGPSLDESRSITAEAATNCILYPISKKTLKEK